MTGFAPAFAADGIDELLFGFMARPGRRPDVDDEVTLVVRPDELDQTWRITMSAGTIRTTGDSEPADCRISAPAWRLYAFLWNRLDTSHIRVVGDVGVLDVWRATARVRWS